LDFGLAGFSSIERARPVSFEFNNAMASVRVGRRSLFHLYRLIDFGCIVILISPDGSLGMDRQAIAETVLK
jgi:hypothetical protein